jgi:hypothetical protein
LIHLESYILFLKDFLGENGILSSSLYTCTEYCSFTSLICFLTNFTYSVSWRRESLNFQKPLPFILIYFEWKYDWQSDQNLIEIEEKKSQLRILRQNEMRGQYIRSRTRWIEEGEKCTNFFCNLEKTFHVCFNISVADPE